MNSVSSTPCWDAAAAVGADVDVDADVNVNVEVQQHQDMPEEEKKQELHESSSCNNQVPNLKNPLAIEIPPSLSSDMSSSTNPNITPSQFTFHNEIDNDDNEDDEDSNSKTANSIVSYLNHKTDHNKERLRKLRLDREHEQQHEQQHEQHHEQQHEQQHEQHIATADENVDDGNTNIVIENQKTNQEEDDEITNEMIVEQPQDHGGVANANYNTVVNTESEAESIPVAIEKQGIIHVTTTTAAATPTATANTNNNNNNNNNTNSIPITTATTDSSVPLTYVPSRPSYVLLEQASLQQQQQQQQQQQDTNQLELTPMKSNHANIAFAPNISLPPHLHHVASAHAIQFAPTTPASGQVIQTNTSATNSARRTMKLRLEEETRVVEQPPSSEEYKKGSILSRMTSLRSTSSTNRRKSYSFGNAQDEDYVSKVFSTNKSETHDNQQQNDHRQDLDNNEIKIETIDRGTISVSWYAGTTTVELQEHVKKSVERKLGVGSKKLLRNFRVLDATVEPNEEIVLSSYIPNGSEFLCRFRIKTVHWKPSKRAPDSPSAAPSPPGELDRLQDQIRSIVESETNKRKKPLLPNISGEADAKESSANVTPKPYSPGNDDIVAHNHVLSQRLEKLSETLLHIHEDGPYGKEAQEFQPVDKRQVAFNIANYFILFLSLIAISAEIHERAPRWISWIDENVTSVRNCAADRDTLFECVSQGDFSGLVASIIIWGTKSVNTKRFFLLGFDSPTKLWTVVYEAGVSAFCWGVSYMFIRRGLNPDTRPNFLTRYWKDAVYGGLAGFNAAFMKGVLKNLIPQEQMLDVLDQRQLRIVNFLEKLFSPGN